MEIGVMYSDQAIVWAGFSSISILRTDGVLFITMTTERGNRRALVTRLWDRFNGKAGPGWSGSDNYAIGVDVAGDQFFVQQWNDGLDSLRVRSISAPHSGAQTRQRIKTFPSRYKVHIFTGKFVPDNEWKTAIAKFEAEMH